MYFEAIFREKCHYNQGSFLSAIPGGFSSVVPTEGQHRPAVDRPLALEEQRYRCFVPLCLRGAVLTQLPQEPVRGA